MVTRLQMLSATLSAGDFAFEFPEEMAAELAPYFFALCAGFLFDFGRGCPDA